jgi:hypothetical protein
VLNWIRNGILDFYVQYFRLEMLKKTKQNKKTKTKQKTKQRDQEGLKRWCLKKQKKSW